MLNILRQRNVQRKIFIGLAIAIIPSFLFWGVMINQEDAKTMGPLGRYGKHPISVRDYLDSYRAVQHQMQFMFGDRWTEMRRYVNMKGEAWDRILLYEESKRRGIRVSDQEVVDWVAGQTAFQRQGKYYPELYRMAVREAFRMEPRDFEEEMRKTLAIQKLAQKILAETKVDDSSLRELFNKERSLRDIEYAVLAADPAAPAPAIEDSEIAAVYDAVKNNLTAPEKVRLSFLALSKDEAESKKDILSDTSSNLETLAGKLNVAVKTTGFFSRNEAVPEIGLSREILEAAFSLPSGGESPWIPYEQSTFKIKVDEKQAARTLTLEESKEEIRRQLVSQKAVEASIKKLNETKAAVDKDGFAAAVQAAGLTIQSFDGFKAEAYLPGIGPAQLVAPQVMALKEGETSGALAVTNGAALVRIKKDHAPDDAAFEKEKEEFRKQAASRKSQDSIKDLLEKLRQDLRLDPARMKEIFPEEDASPGAV